uniref:Uncharacterized protein n=1 Tax=Rhizophora mucronata TaxID=61149 RepID=A0A2P2N4T6_RHIMU
MIFQWLSLCCCVTSSYNLIE